MKSNPPDLSGVKVTEAVRDPSPFKVNHDPAHLVADKEGNVPMSNAKVIEEMVYAMAGMWAYDPSISTSNRAKSMSQKTLELERV